jgi:hypothetical protein
MYEGLLMKINIKQHIVYVILFFVVLAGIRTLLQVHAETVKPAVDCHESDPNVHVRAEINSIEIIRQVEECMYFRIHAHFHLANISDDPIFLLRGLASVSSFPFCDIAIARTKAQALSCLYIYDTDSGAYSSSIEPWMKDLYEKLDHEMPPADILRRMEPKAYWKFEKEVDFSISKYSHMRQEGGNSLGACPRISFSKPYSAI